MRVLVTGGAGFVGSHLCERLLADGHEVLCYDSLLTGSLENLEGANESGRFEFRQVDVTRGLDVDGPLDWIMHLASPASPVDYLRHPIHTLELGSVATLHALRLAAERGARFFLASTSEVYGNPEVHPQTEDYWGRVNPIGPRSVYDEAKRFAEAAATAFERSHGVPVRIVRIFNTYGPRMRRGDGRAVPSFVEQALSGRAITVHGDGTQTRSLCFVDDLVDGLVRLAASDVSGPVNIGNPREVTVLELAEMVRSLTGSNAPVSFTGRPVDDPDRRRPDITRASTLLGWEPTVPLEEGLRTTIEWCRARWGVEAAAASPGA